MSKDVTFSYLGLIFHFILLIIAIYCFFAFMFGKDVLLEFILSVGFFTITQAINHPIKE